MNWISKMLYGFKIKPYIILVLFFLLLEFYSLNTLLLIENGASTDSAFHDFIADLFYFFGLPMYFERGREIFSSMGALALYLFLTAFLYAFFCERIIYLIRLLWDVKNKLFKS